MHTNGDEEDSWWALVLTWDLHYNRAQITFTHLRINLVFGFTSLYGVDVGSSFTNLLWVELARLNVNE
jgi:hypothetical protein